MSRPFVRLAVTVSMVLLGATLNLSAQVPGEGGERPGPGRDGPGRGGPSGRALALLLALDADGSGEISAAEMEGAATALKGLDRNKDGKISADELVPQGAPGAPGGPGGRGGRGGRGGPGGPPGLGGGAGFGGGAGAAVDSPATAGKDDAEKKILAVIRDVDENQRRGNMTVPEVDGRLLRMFAESVGAKKVVEIGTSVGYSGLWFCLALRTTGGKLITHDIDERRQSAARENFKRAGVEDIVTPVLGDAHKEVSRLEGPVDVVFIDADKEGYTDYLKKLLPLVRPGGLILAHNMNMRGGGINEYVEALAADPALETVILSPPGSGGLSVTLKKR